MDQRNFITTWQEIHTIIDEALEKRDRSVSIFLNPDYGLSVSVQPWPDYEDLYNMYRDGKISFNDFRMKVGLSMLKEEEFLKWRANHGAETN